MADARELIGAGLNDKMTAEQVLLLMDEVLAINKRARGWCPNCSRQVWVEIPDANAVTMGITRLADQSWGKTPEVQVAQGVSVSYRVEIVDEKAVLEAEEAV